ncbi:integron gene cassette protein [Rhodopirellula sp. SWK7]|nr:integron gene cassette protein [Rhodopirellula sp. SWK7]
MIQDQLAEAHAHLGELISEMNRDSQFDQVDTMIRLGHIYGHLNRFCYGRKIPGGDVDQLHTDSNSEFPDDVTLT